MACILLIEDNPGDVRLIKELLKEADNNLSQNHAIKHVERVNEAVELLLQPHDIDIILSDITLPDSAGMQTLKTLGKAAADLPILFMTGTNDEALAMAAMHEGAQDYLVKGRHDGDALSRAIQYAIERKKAQQEMNRLAARDQASKQRIKLLASQKAQLLELNRAKDEFVSIASHQLRTPATAVKQYIGMITEGFVGDVASEQLKLLQAAYESNERQLMIINELLRTARLDSQNYRLKLSETNLTKLIKQVIFNLKPMLDMRHQTVIFEVTERHCSNIDAAEMGLVIENIIENASKYSPPHKQITVNLEKADDCLKISVSDQGVGIDKHDQKIIFDKFTRVDNDLSDTVTGTGLGLYWAKRIIKLHKGSLSVSSKLGAGSTFTMSLPT